jgi:phosphopantothenoylcysteine decarboxylase / phosphopantothenate---cysteine ligase
MTEGATEFVTPLCFQSISQNYVVYDMFKEPNHWEIQHISLAKKADLFVIAPATANIIGKIANGIADDMLSTTVMATKAPVLIAPAMNCNMYENPIVQGNIETLKNFGYKFVEPEVGRLACGDTGSGKLANTDTIVDMIEFLLYQEKDLEGKHVLVTAGPTREDIDPVRFITNRSTGKMGYALAKAARNRGAEVTLISGPVNLSSPNAINIINVYSAQDMYEAVINNFEKMDIIIKAAAVADYIPENKSELKIKKSEDNMTMQLSRSKDILMEVGTNKTSQVVVGFAAETNDIVENARLKIEKKNLDLIVVNNVLDKAAGFGVDTNSVKIIDNEGNISEIPNMSKEEVAHKILDAIIKIER